MPPERKPAQKRRQLPFKPPSRTSSTAAAPASSSSTTSKPKGKATTKSTTTTAASKRGPKPKEASAKASSSKSARPRPSSPSPADSDEDSNNDNDNASSSPARSDASSPEPEPEPDYILAEIIHKDQPSDDVLTNDPVIPPKLLTRLLHHHFQNEKTKIAKDANTVVAKYVDVFVREALARAAFERTEAVGKGASVGDGFLEVEDLEKMAPQLVMDF
ncbi:hypothetical protein AtubIFM55763_004133 [Aspergillus tubingensis]|nr:CENP-S associating centromere protein X-domain-containing protein [Aspergillus tubingensis]GFN14468.1 CENP-S associating centromere protein X-domain-containing protein [Aspergillus tubingensis]GLA57283.1 hypothetical protein AtubIFM54640_003414 [Aspergillus tubingensis]GLA73225.1 hypothetical protein AtubIFM55763_004133 [Aspergillus tubingensis]GLA87956.1 hypothetical protein AtubIFM56815_002390 [Aspergillus tubingensis]GLA95587.1 hypothetical protein AtubIFM57143_002605 [Aspergillus tubing